ncbi:Ig-like domain-containing protein [Brevibacillus brevis]|uniref:Ig-like domain-containing protein n=1 Tax=Brevibacillus brevis TaxID=1393 RepID=A0ABY9T492_BREBE|nr:Ig-like domain-containing protein [Brevibacillus brevis]WNC14831.1 Ig-like domain-containing protein [Brevibacillus brevis]
MKRRTNSWLQALGMVVLLVFMARPTMAAEGSAWGIKLSPADKAGEVAPDTLVTLSFSGPVRLMNNKEPANSSWTSMIQLTDSKKKRVPFTVSWNKASRTVTIDPVGNLEAGQTFKVTLPAKKLKNERGQVNPEVTSVFSTKKPVDKIAPLATILPGHGAKQVKLQDKVTLQFSEEVLLSSGGTLSSKTAGPLVRLTDEAGASIAHTITWNKSKRMLTVKPKGKWLPYKTYQIEVLPGLLRDTAGNPNPAQRSTFTTGAK